MRFNNIINILRTKQYIKSFVQKTRFFHCLCLWYDIANYLLYTIQIYQHLNNEYDVFLMKF